MAGWPKTYRYLADCDDASVDEALAAAARQIEGYYLRYAIEVLLHRSQPVGLGAVIENFHRLPADLKAKALEAEAPLASAMRSAIREIEPQTRVNCLEIASRTGSESLAYLFDLGLMDTQPKVRESAAAMMQQMARRLLADHPLLVFPGTAPLSAESLLARPDPNRLTMRRHHFFEALLSGAQRYESHLRAEIVEACLWFEPYIGEPFWGMMRTGRSPLPRLIGELLARSPEPQVACFLVQAIGSADLRPAAIQAISERRDMKWFQGVLRGVDLWRCSSRVRKGWAFIKNISLLETADQEQWQQLGSSSALPVLIGAGNLPSQQKDEWLQQLWRVGSADCRQEVLLELDRSGARQSPLLKTTLLESNDPQELRLAAYLLRRGKYEGLAGDLAKRLSKPQDLAARQMVDLTADEIFWRLWTRFDAMPEARRVAALNVIRSMAGHLRVRLRVHMASASSSWRVRAVRMTSMLGMVEELWRDVLAVAQDENSRPRSAAVRLLGRSRRGEMAQQLREALDDPDGRVQANAIEAIDEAGWPDRVDLISGKLHSENNRVRANAARVLARAGLDKASEVITAMLNDSRVEHRMTAIWTIKTIDPVAWLVRLNDLAENDPASPVRRFAQSICRQVHEMASGTAGQDGAAPPAVPEVSSSASRSQE